MQSRLRVCINTFFAEDGGIETSDKKPYTVFRNNKLSTNE